MTSIKSFSGDEADTRKGDSLIQRTRSDSPEHSCVSIKSDWSMDPPPRIQEDKRASDLSERLRIEPDDPLNSKNSLQKKPFSVYQEKLKFRLSEKYKRINDGISEHGGSELLQEIYTELYITEGWRGDVSHEHEVRQIEVSSRKSTSQEIPISCNEIFKGSSNRTVLTKGVAGIGKTVTVQKFILDWAQGHQNQDVTFIIPLSFRELNLIKQRKLSLMKLVHHFLPEIKQLELLECDFYKIIMIFDGLDECRLPLNFRNNQILRDVTEPASVDVLLTNLIKKNLLPSALLWITSRPGAASQIPCNCVDLVTEVRGFSDPQKEEYFRKKIKDQRLSKKIVSHIKSSRSLHIMCQIPVFCWITASVLEKMLGGAEGGETPKTLTQMFTHFLIFQIKHKNQKYHGIHEHNPQKTLNTILALGKLAFQQLEKGNLIFYEEDLRECGIEVSEAAVYSGVCTQIFRKETDLHLEKVFSFIHLSVQEFLAALFALLQFILNNRNVIKEQNTGNLDPTNTDMSAFLMGTVSKSLESQNGHMDLFLRFLLGLSLESNQKLLEDLLTQSLNTLHNEEETIEFIKDKIKNTPSTEKCINLFYCLNELNDDSLVQDIQTYLNRGGNHPPSISPDQWAALVFMLLNSEEELDDFILKNYNRSHEGLLRLLPVIKESRKARLYSCNLTAESCTVLSSVLTSSSNSLRMMDLSNNDLQDDGIKLLSTGLQHPHCKLLKLWLFSCNLTEGSCAALSSVFSSRSSSLRDLNLCNNNLKDSGMKLLSAGLQHPHCKLEILRLCKCKLTEDSCAVLSSVLIANPRLKHLELSNNDLKDSGMKLLSAGLQHPHCALQILRLCGCSVTEEGCVALASALRWNPSSQLLELNLQGNKPGDSGLKLLSELLQNPNHKLQHVE